MFWELKPRLLHWVKTLPQRLGIGYYPHGAPKVMPYIPKHTRGFSGPLIKHKEEPMDKMTRVPMDVTEVDGVRITWYSNGSFHAEVL